MLMEHFRQSNAKVIRYLEGPYKLTHIEKNTSLSSKINETSINYTQLRFFRCFCYSENGERIYGMDWWRDAENMTCGMFKIHIYRT